MNMGTTLTPSMGMRPVSDWKRWPGIHPRRFTFTASGPVDGGETEHAITVWCACNHGITRFSGIGIGLRREETNGFKSAVATSQTNKTRKTII